MPEPQRWECPKCKRTYSAPIPVLEVRCNTGHSSAGVAMVLIAGTLTDKRNPRRKQ